MDFDSPETEQDFPGLYAESKSPEDEGRKILPVKKKKDKGYKAFEEDGSGGSHDDLNKTSKSSSRFKFGKSSVKSATLTASSKPVKVKLFGVDLKQVVQRNPNDDRKYPMIPRFLTRALDYLEAEHKPGANFYKGTSHFKSKIQSVRHALNYGEEIPLQEPKIVAGLVKLFVRELPGHILGTVLESKLEDGKVSEKKTKKLQTIYTQEVPNVNRAVFERLVTHMEVIGIDLTPLLKVSQKSLALLKPVMTPLSVEDELRVEESRLARIHCSLAKAKESKDKTKTKDNEEKLWEIQRNVTQLKRKLKQIGSQPAADEKDVVINCEERSADDEPAEKVQSKEDAEEIVVEEKTVTLAEEPEEEVQVQGVVEVVEDPEPEVEEEAETVEPAKKEEILQPIPASVEQRPPTPKADPEESKETSRVDIDDLDFTRTSTPFRVEETVANETNKTSLSPFVVDEVDEPISKPDALSGKPLEFDDVPKLQNELRYVLAEQVELLKVNHDLRRSIRDEHKQIKMIQMVRNHRYRQAMKPNDDSMDKMSTEKLQDVLRRLMENNKLLTKQAEQLADKVFKERMNLAEVKARERCSFLAF